MRHTGTGRSENRPEDNERVIAAYVRHTGTGRSENRPEDNERVIAAYAVSYTHLTLPTSSEV